MHTLDSFTDLNRIRQGGVENEGHDLNAYFQHVITESASHLRIDLSTEERVLLHEILTELATQEGVNKPLGPQETMVELLLEARVTQEVNPRQAGVLYKRAGDSGLLAAGGIGHIPKLMRGAGPAEKQRKLITDIKRFLEKENVQDVGSSRSYYQEASASAYRQASTLGYRWHANIGSTGQNEGALIIDMGNIKHLMAYAESQEKAKRMGAKRALLEEIARRVPILSDLLFFVKTLCIDGNLLLASQIADQSRKITGVLGLEHPAPVEEEN